MAWLRLMIVHGTANFIAIEFEFILGLVIKVTTDPSILAKRQVLGIHDIHRANLAIHIQRLHTGHHAPCDGAINR